MDRIRLPQTDLDVSRLCYGGVAWGVELSNDQMDRLLGVFRDAGGNFLDTAHGYSYWVERGTGASEIALGNYLRRCGGRDGWLVATKGGLPGLAGYRSVDRHLSPQRIAGDIDDSLGRLRIDTIDLYWLHRDDPREAAGDIIEALNAEARRGRVRYLGASNWTSARIEEANLYAAAHGLRGFVASQPEWCLGEPNRPLYDETLHFFDDADRRWSEAHGFPVVPYTPTARGYFASSGRAGADAFDNATNRARLERVERLAGELRCSPGQVALAWLTNQPFPVIPILGTTKEHHLRDAIGSLTVKLTREQLRWLEG